MKTKSDLKGVLFDIDGTLLDSNRQHASAWREAMAEDGFSVSFENIFHAIGMGADNLLPSLLDINADSRAGKKISEREQALFEKKYLDSLQPFSQVAELVARVKDLGLKVGIATSAKEDILARLLEIAGIAEAVDKAADSDAVEKSKPDADVITASAGRLGIALQNVIMIGDTPYDVLAARRVGVDTIGVLCGGWTQADLKGAVAIFRDPEDLVTHFNESPIYIRGRSNQEISTHQRKMSGESYA